MSMPTYYCNKKKQFSFTYNTLSAIGNGIQVLEFSNYVLILKFNETMFDTIIEKSLFPKTPLQNDENTFYCKLIV